MSTSALQVARTGLDAQSERMRIIANNLANVTTTAFQRDRAEFATLAYQMVTAAGARSAGDNQYATGLNLGTGVRLTGTGRITSQGSHIAKGLDGLFRQTDGGTLPADPQAPVISASLESSNVNTSQTLIDMIEASRSWDMQLQLVTSARDMDTSAADLMRLPS